jgi:uncharacterized membrane protein
MGGLFAAQNQQLQQMMPNVTSAATGANVGSGNFGSLRGQTAYNKAIGDAVAQQNAAQYQAALQNQATGVNAATGAGNVTNQGLDQLLKVGQYEQASPFTNVSNYGKVLSSVQAPTTVTNQTQLSPLNQIAGILSAIGTGAGGTGILSSVGGLSGLVDSITKWYNSGGTDTSGFGGSTAVVDPNYDPSGGIYGPTEGGGNIADDTGNSDQ